MIKLIIRASFCFQLIGLLNILTLKQAERGLGLVVEVLITHEGPRVDVV